MDDPRLAAVHRGLHRPLAEIRVVAGNDRNDIELAVGVRKKWSKLAARCGSSGWIGRLIPSWIHSNSPLSR